MSTFNDWMEREIDRRGIRKEVEEELARLKLQQAIVALRRKRNLSQRELARRMAVSPTVLARIESGESRNVTVGTLLRIARVLDARLTIRLRPTAKRSKARKRGRATDVAA